MQRHYALRLRRLGFGAHIEFLVLCRCARKRQPAVLHHPETRVISRLAPNDRRKTGTRYMLGLYAGTSHRFRTKDRRNKRRVSPPL